MKSFTQVYEKLRSKKGLRIAVAAAADKPVLEAVRDAASLGVEIAYLAGDEEKIRELAEKVGIDMSKVEIIHEPDPKKAALKAVSLVHEGKASVLMKGLVSSADFLRAVLNKEVGLRTGKTLSSVTVLKTEKMDRFVIMTDGGMNMYPTLEEKVHILENTVPVCKALEIEDPKAAAVCAVEVVNPAMQATLDAATLAVMSQRGQIKGIMVDGPLGMDNALSLEAAKHKGITSPVAGKADVVLMPDIEAGNIMYKTLVYMGDVQTGSLIMGASAPIVMTSRADSPETKLNSLAVALLIN